MYASVNHMRAEGVTEGDADDARVLDALQAATETIDRVCGWFFEPREQGFALSGRGGPTVELPVPPITVSTLRIGVESYAPDDFHVVGAPVGPSFFVPKLVRRAGTFPRGHLNIFVRGVFGYTVPCEESPKGQTPAAVRRATVLLAASYIQPAASDDPTLRAPWRLIEERTRDQSYRLEPLPLGEITGHPEVDALLLPYRRPFGLGAT